MQGEPITKCLALVINKTAPRFMNDLPCFSMLERPDGCPQNVSSLTIPEAFLRWGGSLPIHPVLVSPGQELLLKTDGNESSWFYASAAH